MQTNTRLTTASCNLSNAFIRIGFKPGRLKTGTPPRIDGKTIDLEFNRHIEVKGSTQCDLSFFWSSGQIEKAREKGDEYWIYFVPGIDRQNEAHNGEIIKIKNPAYEIIDSKKYSIECVKFHVTKK